MQTPVSLVIHFIDKYEDQLRADVVKFARQDAENNECGLAYDAIIFEIQNGYFLPTSSTLEEIQSIAIALGIEYPKLSTD